MSRYCTRQGRAYSKEEENKIENVELTESALRDSSLSFIGLGMGTQ